MRVIIMFNQEIKEKFLVESTLSAQDKNSARGLFNISEPFETSVQKDIVQMNSLEASHIVTAMKIRELSHVYLANTVFRAYMEWCRTNSVFKNINSGFLEVCTANVDITKQIVEDLFPTDAAVFRELRKVCDFNDGYTEPAMFALAWLGLTPDESHGLLDSEIDLEHRVIYDHQGGILIPRYNDTISEVLTDYAACNVGFREHRLGARTVVKDRSVDNFLKRFGSRTSTSFGQPITKRSFGASASRLNKKYQELGNPPRFTYENVWKSGRYNAMYELESSGVDVLAPENQDLIIELFRNQKYYRGIVWFYPSYKKAFNL